MKFRKKPIIIDAFVYGFHKAPQWFEDALNEGNVSLEWTNSDPKTHPCDFIVINTLEGTMRASYGFEYIIKGVKGEIYPCDPEIFEMSYESVENET